jgi:hypothetical protein
MSIICCILGGSEIADFHLLWLDWENDKQLDTKVDAAIEDGEILRVTAFSGFTRRPHSR